MLKCKLTALSQLLVGAGREYPYIDADIQAIRLCRADGSLIPYIPASSLKGVFRATAERIAREKFEVCNVFSNSCGKEFSRELREKEEKGEDVEPLIKKLCKVCQVFGSLGFESPVRFSNAMPLLSPEMDPESLIDTQTMISIDRNGRANPRTLEYIKPGTSFQFTISFKTKAEDWMVGLLLKVIEMINQEKVQIGGQKTRGYGWCKIEILNLREDERGRCLEAWDRLQK